MLNLGPPGGGGASAMGNGTGHGTGAGKGGSGLSQALGSHVGTSLDIVVSRSAHVDKKGVGVAKFNPVSHWKISTKAITGESLLPCLGGSAVVMLTT